MCCFVGSNVPPRFVQTLKEHIVFYTYAVARQSNPRHTRAWSAHVLIFLKFYCYCCYYYSVTHRNILHEIRKRKANWIGHILRRNCLLQRVTEGKIQGGIEVTQEDKEEDVRSYWMTLRKGEDTLI